MSRSVNAVVVAVAIFVVLAGSIFYFTVLRDPSDVQVRLAGWGWQETGTGTAAWFTVEAESMLDLDVELRGYDASLDVNGERVGSNRSFENATLGPGETRTLRLVFDVPAESVSAWLRGHVEGQESSEAAVRGTLRFEGPEGPFSVELDESWEWSTGAAGAVSDLSACRDGGTEPCVQDVEASWAVRDETTWLTTTWTIKNPAQARAVLGPGHVYMAWAGIEVASRDVPETEIEAGSSADLAIDLGFEHAALVDWWPTHVAACERSAMTLSATAPWNVSEPDETPDTSNNSTGSGTGSGTGNGTGNNSTNGNRTGNNSTVAPWPEGDLHRASAAPSLAAWGFGERTLPDDQDPPAGQENRTAWETDFEMGEFATGIACRED